MKKPFKLKVYNHEDTLIHEQNFATYAEANEQYLLWNSEGLYLSCYLMVNRKGNLHILDRALSIYKTNNRQYSPELFQGETL